MARICTEGACVGAFLLPFLWDSKASQAFVQISQEKHGPLGQGRCVRDRQPFGRRAEENRALPGTPAVSINFPIVEGCSGRELFGLMQNSGLLRRANAGTR